MATQEIPGCLWIPSPKFNNLSTVPSFTTTTFQIDAADEGAAFMLRIPKTGNISKVLWGTRNVTNGSTITVRGETWDETTTQSQPSGTLFHANFTGTSVIANADDNIPVLTTLSAAVAVTRGDKIALVIKQPNTSFGNLTIAAFSDDAQNFPYSLLNTGVSPAVSWSVASLCTPCIAFEYDDGSYAWIPSIYPFHAITTTAFANSSTPDEIGLRFKLPFPARISHWWAWVLPAGNFNVNLYDSDGATKIAGGAFAVDKDSCRTSSAAELHLLPFTSTADLTANTYYRMVIEPSTTTNVSLYDFTVNTAAVMDAFEGGQNFHLTSAKNPAAEGDWTNTTTRRPFMGIGLSGFSDGAGAGGMRSDRGMVAGMLG